MQASTPEQLTEVPMAQILPMPGGTIRATVAQIGNRAEPGAPFRA